ncbi:phage tail tape measure protein [Paenibacillus caui]|uniref:phage tail tape measure protein n=1 Tax=Paenibacillus caui TaxID=2873927 RepID=UPI001CA9C668|nr:phage tail tape measure protein [Paenibacillus caui]
MAVNRRNTNKKKQEQQEKKQEEQNKQDEQKKKKADEANAKITAFNQASIDAIMKFGKASVTAASEFEKSMSRIQMATGATNQQMKATKEIAKNLYAQNFGKDWEEVGSAISKTVELTGQQGTALEQTTKNAFLLKEAMGYDVASSVKSANSLMKNFGVTSDQAFGLIAQGKTARLDIKGDMLGSIDKYAKDFKALGFSANQMFNMFAAGAQNGEFSLDDVGSTIQEFKKRATSGSEASMKAFNSLGLNAKQMKSAIAAGGPSAKAAFGQITSSIAKITNPVKQNSIAMDLFGSKFDDVQGKVVSAMGTVQGKFDMTRKTMDGLNQTRMNQPGQAMEIFKRQIAVDILLPVGEQLMPALNKFGQWLTSHEPLLKDFGAALADGIGKTVDYVSSVLSDILPYLDSFANVSLSIFQHVTQWEGLVPVISGVIAALAAYKTMVTLITLATGVLNAVQTLLEANPILLIITALIGLGVGLVVAYKKCEWFRNMVNGVWNAIKIGAAAVMNFFVVQIPAFFNLIASFFTVKIPAIANSIVGFFVTWGQRILSVIMFPISWIANFIATNWTAIRTKTITIFNGIVSFVMNSWTQFRDQFMGVFSGIGDFFTGIWDGIKGVFFMGINWVIDQVNDLIGMLNRVLNFEIFGHKLGITIPTIDHVVSGLDPKTKAVGGGGGSGSGGIVQVAGSYATGLPYVPYDGFIAELHKGERVLTADENKAYSSPVQAPARVNAGNGGSRMDIHLTVDVQGSSLDSKQTSDLMVQFRQAMQQVFQETMRRGGLEGVN